MRGNPMIAASLRVLVLGAGGMIGKAIQNALPGCAGTKAETLMYLAMKTLHIVSFHYPVRHRDRVVVFWLMASKPF